MSTPTTNYGWPMPTVNADAGTWGTELNTALQDIDTQVFTLSGQVPTYTSVQQGGQTGQGTNKINLGWNGGALTVFVDGTAQGGVPAQNSASGFLQVSGNSSSPKVYASTAAPSGGNDGDIWLQYV